MSFFSIDADLLDEGRVGLRRRRRSYAKQTLRAAVVIVGLIITALVVGLLLHYGDSISAPGVALRVLAVVVLVLVLLGIRDFFRKCPECGGRLRKSDRILENPSLGKAERALRIYQCIRCEERGSKRNLIGHRKRALWPWTEPMKAQC